MSDELSRCSNLVKVSLVGITIGSKAQFIDEKCIVSWAEGDGVKTEGGSVVLICTKEEQESRPLLNMPSQDD